MITPDPFTNHCFTDQQPATQWLPIPGFPNYQISDDGRVKSLKPSGEKVLSPGYKGKYPYVLLSHNGKRKSRTIHSLLIEAFVGPAQGRLIRFKDGNRKNITLANLEYCDTQADLMAASVLLRERAGKETCRLKAINHEVRVRLRDAITQRIRSLCKDLKQAEVAEMIGLSISSISRIVSGERGYGGWCKRP
jgi:DNA-binding Xre family transcriptional regulator